MWIYTCIIYIYIYAPAYFPDSCMLPQCMHVSLFLCLCHVSMSMSVYVHVHT